MGDRKPGLLGSMLFVLCAISAAASAAEKLTVAQAGPEGEIAKIEEANEIHVMFSEPMVALGRIPDPVKAPFVHIEPAIKGTFRWSGTRLLIFTPDKSKPVPRCTTFHVSIDTTAVSLDGRPLDQPYAFAFTTPTVRVLEVDYYRTNDKATSPAILSIRFNQPVSPAKVSEHIKLSYGSYEWQAPTIADDAREALQHEDPNGYSDFQKKVDAVSRVISSGQSVSFKVATDWDRERFKPGDDLVVLETTGVPASGAHIVANLDPDLPGIEGSATPGKAQTAQFEMEPAFFVDRLQCSTQCSTEFWNGIVFRGVASVKDLLAHLTVKDVTDPAHPVVLTTPKKSLEDEDFEEEEQDYWSEEERDATTYVSFDRLGFPVKPAHNYLLVIDKNLTSDDGQVLGYTWCGRVEYWHKSAFTSFGTGHGVWESSGGPQLPFYARNLTSVKEWLAPVKPEELVPTILRIDGLTLKPDGSLETTGGGNRPPAVNPSIRSLVPTTDAIQTFGLNLSKLLMPSGTGLVWAAIQRRAAVDLSYKVEEDPHATLIQVTNLGITVKDSPQNTLIMVTRLDNGDPVEAADVEIRTPDNKVFWKGTTTSTGVALAPGTATMPSRAKLSRWEIPWNLAFVVIARKGDDIAYVCSDWNEGIRSYDFDITYNPDEAKPQLRGAVFADRGVYKLGEEVHFKAILRSDTVDGIKMVPAGASVAVLVTDTEGQEISKQTLALSEWSTADWVLKLPHDAPLGSYTVEATVAGQQGSATGSFLVAAYRKPDFRVDANLGGADDIAGATLKGVITARYLFGAPMKGVPVRISYSKTPISTAPDKVTERFPAERYAYLKEAWGTGPEPQAVDILTKDEMLSGEGSISLDLPTDLKAGDPYSYSIEGEVTDVSRQTIAGRAGFAVHAAPWYLGLKRPSYFVTGKDGVHTDVVAVTPRGDVTAGVAITAILSQIQWNSVRRAEGDGFYTWESERVEKEKWRRELTSAVEPVPLDVPIAEGGYYVLAITATDHDGRQTTTNTDFYALGEGYTAWERFDHNRIDLVPEKKTYRPGETARIMIKSPWEKATALLTVEREGIRTHRELALTSSQQTVEVPVTEAEIPNVFVSVLLVKGRTSTTIERDGSDPGKPGFKLGYTELKVENSRRRLAVTVATDKQEYRPADQAKVSVEVKAADGKPVIGEVTLWAVDYGVLSLTGYATPDVLDSIYAPKALQVTTEDSRQNIVSRRVITPKGAEEGGGGGFDEGPENKVRKDFRVLAFWIGSAVTNSDGKLTVTEKLPEDLTTYRIMAVVNDKEQRFGRGDAEIRLSKPVLLTPAFPRFLAVRDKAYFGAVLHSLLKQRGSAIVTMKSLDPAILSVTDSGTQSVDIPAGGSVEARFRVEAKATGEARILISAKLLGETDAFELALPVRILSTPEVMAAYGTATPTATETVELPADVLGSFGGLHLDLSSTAMVGLGEGARYLVDYPYGCAEQRASCALALLLAADLGDAFRLPGISPADLRKVTEETLKELEDYQRDDGGFSFWKESLWKSDPYLTSYILHVYQRARKMGYSVPQSVLDNAYAYLEPVLSGSSKPNEQYVPCYTAWQAFATWVLAEAGKSVGDHLTRLYEYRERMPIFGQCYLLNAMRCLNEQGSRPQEIRRRIMNAILREGGASHVEELADPYLMWYWNSNVRSTAIVLQALVRGGKGDRDLANELVRWLMTARKDGRWGNTQENAWAMEGLVDFYRAFEAEVPDFTAVASLALQPLMKESFKGREATARSSDTPMEKLLSMGKPGERLPLNFTREGTGTLYYGARLRYAAATPPRNPMDMGIAIERTYEPLSGGAASTSFKAGDLVQVTLSFDLTKERRWVAVTDPIPAGFEPVESWFKTTSADLARSQEKEEEGGDWVEWWQRGGFDHVERHDDRVLLFATRLSEGKHSFRYVCRATTAGTFVVAPARVEEMYTPEVFGHTAGALIEVKP